MSARTLLELLVVGGFLFGAAVSISARADTGGSPGISRPAQKVKTDGGVPDGGLGAVPMPSNAVRASREI